MLKSLMPSATKNREGEKVQESAVLAETSRLKRFFQQNFQAATFKQWR